MSFRPQFFLHRAVLSPSFSCVAGVTVLHLPAFACFCLLLLASAGVLLPLQASSSSAGLLLCRLLYVLASFSAGFLSCRLLLESLCCAGVVLYWRFSVLASSSAGFCEVLSPLCFLLCCWCGVTLSACWLSLRCAVWGYVLFPPQLMFACFACFAWRHLVSLPTLSVSLELCGVSASVCDGFFCVMGVYCHFFQFVWRLCWWWCFDYCCCPSLGGFSVGDVSAAAFFHD